MDKGYRRLKIRLLLGAVLGAAAAGLLALFLVEVVIDGVLQDPVARLFTWACTGVFGQSQAQALELYQLLIRNNKNEIITLGLMFLMIVAFYAVLGRITKWLDAIRTATRTLADDREEPITLPKELRPLEDDLNGIRAELRRRREAARESELRKNELVAFLAHDLKTPLTSVVGYLELLSENKNLTVEQRAKYTGIALDKARRLEELLAEFFDITRMDLSAEAAEKVPLQLSMLLEQLADEFYPIFAERELHCEVSIQHHLLVLGDPDKLARVFDNVLRNAVNYSRPGARVEVDAHGADGWAEVIISNEGLDIPEGELSNIFQKFYRLDAARSTRTGGAGLGLAIAREIVEDHGGTIRAESDGKMTRFTIRLPLLEEPQ